MKRFWAKLKRFWAALLVSIFGIGAVMAQSVTDTVSWTAPTTRADGSPLAGTDIQEYRVYSGTVPGGAKTLAGSVAGLSLALPRGAAPVGTRCYVVRTVDTAGAESAPSGEVCKTVNSLPGIPGNVQVQ